MGIDSGFLIPKTRLSTSVLALLMVSIGAGGALLYDRWDDVSSFVLTRLHLPHYKKIVPLQQRTAPVTIVGEVVDAWCYASQTMGPGRGLGHDACALACINGGVSPGILEDGTKILYLAAKYTGYQGCREILLPYVGKRVTVTGLVGDLGGNNVLKIYTVKLAEPAVVPRAKPAGQATTTATTAATSSTAAASTATPSTATTNASNRAASTTAVAPAPTTATATTTAATPTAQKTTAPSSPNKSKAKGAAEEDCAECAK